MERAFRIFDKDGSGTVSLAEFIETMHQFSGQGEDEKISFLFKVYDLNGMFSLFLNNDFSCNSISTIRQLHRKFQVNCWNVLVDVRRMLDCVPKK